jgi:hypothetical protein
MNSVDNGSMKPDRNTFDTKEDKPRSRWLRKTMVILGFLWWIVKVVDWFFQSRGLNRVEFPKYTPGRDLGDGGIQTLFDSDQERKGAQQG